MCFQNTNRIQEKKMVFRYDQFCNVRKILKILKPPKGQKSISYLGFQKLIRNGDPRNEILLQNYQEFLSAIKNHEFLAKSYKLINNTNDQDRMAKTAEFCGLKMNPLNGNIEPDLKGFEKF